MLFWEANRLSCVCFNFVHNVFCVTPYLYVSMRRHWRNKLLFIYLSNSNSFSWLVCENVAICTYHTHNSTTCIRDHNYQLCFEINLVLTLIAQCCLPWNYLWTGKIRVRVLGKTYAKLAHYATICAQAQNRQICEYDVLREYLHTSVD